MKILLKNFVFGALLLLSTAASLAAHASKEDAVAMVKKALAYYKAHGKTQSLPVFSDQKGPFRDGQLFLVVMDMNGNVLSHSGIKTLIGANIFDLKDRNGIFMVKDMIEKAKKANHGWSLPYVWLNPDVNKMQMKETYFEKYDELIFFCGVYSNRQ